ncbi:hypothetical protein, conserved [Eimeria necatrix]|uniref:Uncharacterized protein n=1 Tax=Eimeria necatrix TaxID=51315 RepID=U6MKM7_9EIME|nr:hypothetical protein, conserved [Eimeria necatrix]CDJ62210.1 hypothetical protein, conserved [Eimeria necatrix]
MGPLLLLLLQGVGPLLLLLQGMGPLLLLLLQGMGPPLLLLQGVGPLLLLLLQGMGPLLLLLQGMGPLLLLRGMGPLLPLRGMGPLLLLRGMGPLLLPAVRPRLASWPRLTGTGCLRGPPVFSSAALSWPVAAGVGPLELRTEAEEKSPGGPKYFIAAAGGIWSFSGRLGRPPAASCCSAAAGPAVWPASRLRGPKGPPRGLGHWGSTGGAARATAAHCGCAGALSSCCRRRETGRKLGNDLLSSTHLYAFPEEVNFCVEAPDQFLLCSFAKLPSISKGKQWDITSLYAESCLRMYSSVGPAPDSKESSIELMQGVKRETLLPA